MEYQITVEKATRINTSIQVPRWEVSGRYSDFDQELTLTWQVELRPQEFRWEFIFWENEDRYDLEVFELNQFEERLNRRMVQITEIYQGAVVDALEKAVAEPAPGADDEMTTDEEKG